MRWTGQVWHWSRPTSNHGRGTSLAFSKRCIRSFERGESNRWQLEHVRRYQVLRRSVHRCLSYMLVTDGWFREEQYEKKLLTAMTKFWQQTNACGIVAANRPNFVVRVDFNSQEDIDAGSKIEHILKKATGLKQRLMIVILTSTSSSIYNQVKRSGDIKLVCMLSACNGPR